MLNLQLFNNITYWLLISYEDYRQHNEINGIKCDQIKKILYIFIVILNVYFIVKYPFKNDGGGSYSGGDFIIPIMNFWNIDQNIEKYLQLKYFLYIYIERNKERQYSKFLFFIL